MVKYVGNYVGSEGKHTAGSTDFYGQVGSRDEARGGLHTVGSINFYGQV